MKKIIQRVVFASVICFGFLFVGQAKEIDRVCKYYSGKEGGYLGVDVTFYQDGTFSGLQYYDGHQINPARSISSFKNDDSVQTNYQSLKRCPDYIMNITTVNPTQLNVAGYYLIYGDSDRDNYLKYQGVLTSVTWAALSDKTSLEDDLIQKEDGEMEISSSVKEYKKTYYAEGSDHQFGNLTFYFKYDFQNQYSLSSKMILFHQTQNVIFVHSRVENYTNEIIKPVVEKKTWPTDIYCGKLSVSLSIRNQAKEMFGGEVAAGSIVCAVQKNLFTGAMNDLVHYKANAKTDGNDGQNEDDKWSQVEDLGYTMTDITLGQICKSQNFKVPMRYVGWILMIVRLLIPIIIITLGIIDFMKAVVSQKPEELSKSIKTIAIRAIAGVVIFFIPTVIHVLFSLVDDWTDYKTAYSDCTKCITSPKKC